MSATFSTDVNTKLFVKIIENKKLGTVRVVAAFNVTDRSEKTGRLIFPVQSKCAYVSGDLQYNEVLTAIKDASAHCRTNNIAIDA